MLWMENYFVYCSVRLGVLVISVFSFISCFIPSIVILIVGLTVLSPILKLFNEDEHFRNHAVVKILTSNVEDDSTNLKVTLQLYFFAHMTSCVLAFYGSLKLKKYFLLPLIFFEFWRIIYSLSFHILIMTVSKHHVNLGILIISTLAGGFLILFLGYNWAACVALYQIINLVSSVRYKSLYGDDPFNPLIPDTFNPSSMQNIRVLATPANQDIDEQKKRQTMHNSRAIISVLPVSNLENNSNLYGNNLKRKRNQWPRKTTLHSPPAAENYLPNVGFSTLDYVNRNDNYEDNYKNWQWTELAPAAIKVRNKKNIYLDSKWKY